MTGFDKTVTIYNNRLNIDYLPENTKQAGVEYAIATSPTDELIQRYIDGGERCRYAFVISSVNDYGPDAAQNMLMYWRTVDLSGMTKETRQHALKMRKLYRLDEPEQQRLSIEELDRRTRADIQRRNKEVQHRKKERQEKMK